MSSSRENQTKIRLNKGRKNLSRSSCKVVGLDHNWVTWEPRSTCRDWAISRKWAVVNPFQRRTTDWKRLNVNQLSSSFRTGSREATKICKVNLFLRQRTKPQILRIFLWSVLKACQSSDSRAPSQLQTSNRSKEICIKMRFRKFSKKAWAQFNKASVDHPRLARRLHTNVRITWVGRPWAKFYSLQRINNYDQAVASLTTLESTFATTEDYLARLTWTSCPRIGKIVKRKKKQTRSSSGHRNAKATYTRSTASEWDKCMTAESAAPMWSPDTKTTQGFC